MIKKKCPTCGRDMHYGYGGWLCGICAYEAEDIGLCEDCKHWNRYGIDYSQGSCDNMVDVDGKGTDDDYGCTLWEATEESCD